MACSASEENILRTRIYVMFGPSQAGKSAFINAVSGIPDLAPEGNGSGVSTTGECKEYVFEKDGEKFAFLDVPGICDNYSNTTDEEVMELIREKVNSHLSAMVLESGLVRDTIDGILVFEPLDYEYSRLDKTLERAELLFGKEMLESAVVLYTKGDLDFARFPEECDILPFCLWQSQGVDLTVLNENWSALKLLLGSLDAYHVANMEQVLEEIQIMTKQLCENQQKEYKTIKVPVRRRVQVGTDTKTVTLYKSPVTKYRDETRTEKTRTLASRARSRNDIYNTIHYRYCEKLNAWNAAGRCMSFGANPLHITKSNSNESLGMALQVIPILTDIYMTDISKFHCCDVTAELCRRWPNWSRQGFEAFCWFLLKEIIEENFRASNSIIGFGVDIYEEKTLTQTIKNVPYEYREPYTDTQSTAIYKEHDSFSDDEVELPGRDESEFVHLAVRQKIEEIRDTIKKN